MDACCLVVCNVKERSSGVLLQLRRSVLDEWRGKDEQGSVPFKSQETKPAPKVEDTDPPVLL